ncbi:MAG TPA: agmatine deiminase family protein [Gemmataceae bacterium]|nr:agmatine deiminase family protein [Gemmataceae bacterium]
MVKPQNGLPDGWRMPAEWETHYATWIAWPHQRDDWPGKFGPIPWVFAEIVRHVVRSERVGLLVHDAAIERNARRRLRLAGVDLGRIDFTSCPTDRGWMRDSAGVFVKDAAGSLTLLDWGFNAWAKYDNWTLDDQTPQAIATHLNLPRRAPLFNGRRVVLEGGAIDVNGAGLLLTTEECLLSDVQQRNPGMTRQDYELVFAEQLGVRKVLWLGRGLAGDDTHGHVDDLARFVGPRTVVLVQEDDPGDKNYEPLRENAERLRAMTDLDGRPLEIVPLPMPAPLLFRGQRLPASYANFYIANDCVLVPTFNDPNDRRALNTLAELFPGRAVVGIHAVDLVWGLGTLHCLTQQQPAAP